MGKIKPYSKKRILSKMKRQVKHPSTDCNIEDLKSICRQVERVAIECYLQGHLAKTLYHHVAWTADMVLKEWEFKEKKHKGSKVKK